MNKQEKTDLFSDFDSVSRKEWEERITKDLKGADYKKKLSWHTLEGLDLLPFYMSEDIDTNKTTSVSSLQKSETADWARSEPITASTPEEANQQIKEAVKGGANSFHILCDIEFSDGEIGGNMTGTQIQSQSEFDQMFDGVDVEDKILFFNSRMNTPAIQAMLLNSELSPKNVLFSFDPFTFMARYGRKPLPEDKIDALIDQIQSKNIGKALAADGLFYHLGGATIIQELGASLAIASEYLAQSSDSAQSIFFRLSAGPLYFPEIAKFRALRILWANLLDAYGLDSSLPAFIHAETTKQNQTIADPHNNILRATTEAMAAVVGGVDSLLIHPHDQLYRDQNSFSSRIARNVHHIIGQEAHLGVVSDPAAGSYYVEELTNQIAEKAWDFFRLIEKQGGFLKALEGRVIQSEINQSRDQKLEAYATRKRTLVGTNNYPAINEELPDTVISGPYTDALNESGDDFEIDSGNLIPSLTDALNNGAMLGDLFHSYLNPQKVLYTTLEPFRAGKVFEEIRRRSVSFNKTPVIQLIPTGDTKWRKLRESFAQNLLGCAGFDVRSSNGYSSIDEASEQLSDQPGDIYVLCSSDADYPGLIKSFAQHFSDRGILLLAGKPDNNESKYHEAGIDHFIYSGINIPDFLKSIQDELEQTNLSS